MENPKLFRSNYHTIIKTPWKFVKCNLFHINKKRQKQDKYSVVQVEHYCASTDLLDRQQKIYYHRVQNRFEGF